LGHDSANFFVSPYEGGSDLDRAAAALAGQLGTQARYAQYGQIIFDQHEERLGGSQWYEIVVPKAGLIKNEKGYWSVTIYSQADRFLIPNKRQIYYVSSYNAKPNPDGTYTMRINPEGMGDNAISTDGANFYGIFRVYESQDNLEFPVIKKIASR
jgi:hypothetical protein